MGKEANPFNPLENFAMKKNRRVVYESYAEAQKIQLSTPALLPAR
jgi:hypothetical protein